VKKTFSKQRLRNKRRLKHFMLFFLIIAIVVFLVDLKIRPVIKTMSLNNGKIKAVLTIHKAVSDELSGGDYSSLVNITSDSEGNIKSVSADTVKVNLLKAKVTSAIQQSLEAQSGYGFSVKLGTLFGNEFFQGRGPNIPMKIALSEYVITDIRSELSDAGINQVRHRMMLDITAHINVFIPGYISSSEVETDFCIAETLVVGEVPENYTEIEGDKSDTISRVNDYKAGAN